ncbi:hypothetical protein [uncultured Rothia sp.]|uniref:hypothetical protein n=1 Tax=uncultured Rothia sp. TaxID=316088 RepID=UPI0032170C3E
MYIITLIARSSANTKLSELIAELNQLKPAIPFMQTYPDETRVDSIQQKTLSEPFSPVRGKISSGRV